MSSQPTIPWFTIAVITTQISAIVSITTKTNSRPVHEIVNEQSRSDDVRYLNNPHLPYGNPLAGKQNARLYAQHQQAMFNAERVRQHRAQLQRWTKAPLQVDSYMKAYQDSQESHHLALEQQQPNMATKQFHPVTKATPRMRAQAPQIKRSPIVIPQKLMTKITKEDAVVKAITRDHRSYGSVQYPQLLQPKKFQTVLSLTAGPTYDQGVTIKPNGNVGLTQLKHPQEETKLFTEAIPSKTQYVYPKQYHQMQNYQSAQDIDTLSSILKKPVTDQVSELASLLYANQNEGKTNLQAPIDLYFYLKDQPTPSLYDESYSKSPHNYASQAPVVKDYTPITEEVDDIEDPNKPKKLKTYGLQAILATEAPQEAVDTTTTKSNNYYKVEVASQTISAPYHVPSSGKTPKYYFKPEEQNPSYQALQYAQSAPIYGQNVGNLESDSSEKYLHHNAAHHGIHHLSEDGPGPSAFGDDNVSINNSKPLDLNQKINRTKRSLLNTKKMVECLNITLAESPKLVQDNITAPKAEALISLSPPSFKRKNPFGTFLITPKYPIGEATDYTNDYELDFAPYRPNDYNDGSVRYDFENNDEETPDYNDYNFNVNEPYEQETYNHVDLHGSYSDPNRHFSPYQSLPLQNYGPPQFHTRYGFSSYKPQLSFAEPLPTFAPVNLNDVIEPVYLLTQSQLKSLIGHSNINIKHYDIFQTLNRPSHSPKRYKKRYGSGYRRLKNNLGKLHKLHVI